MKTLLLIVICVLSFSCQKVKPVAPTLVKEAIPAKIIDQQPKLSLVYKVRQPSISSTKTPVLILLHGLGSNESDLFDLAKHIDGRMMVISARAPITLAEKKYSWYNLSRDETAWQYNNKEVLKASATLMQFVAELSKAYGLKDSPIYLAGFSQGAILSLGTALLNPDKIKGAISLSGQLYRAFLDEHRRNYTQLEILVTHGRNDTVLPFSQIVKDVEILKQKGLKPDVHYYDSAHNISNDNFKELLRWLKHSLDKNS